MKRSTGVVATSLIMAVGLAACGSTGGGDGDDADQAASTGPITIWLSNNQQEVAWGEQVVAAWNAANPDEQVSAEEIPAGNSSEEVISAAIAAGNAACLIYNTAPAAVADFEQQGGLVSLSSFEGGSAYIEERSGENAAQFASADGEYYQMPWKANPVVVFYNKAVMQEAGIDPQNPPLATYDEFMETARAISASEAADYAIYPSPSSEFYQPWFDFYPFYAAESGGNQLLVDGQPTFTDADALTVMEFWRGLYAEDLAGQEPYTGDAFVDGVSAMVIAGPWAVASFDGKVDWGTVAIPTSAGVDPDATFTFDDAKNIGMYTACENRQTAWDFLTFSTSLEQDELFLEGTGQIPLRADVATAFAGFFEANEEFSGWATEGNTVAVPNTLNSTEIWQTFRNAWSQSVIFGESDIAETMDAAAETISGLASQ